MNSYDFTIPINLIAPITYGDYSNLNDEEITNLHDFLGGLELGGSWSWPDFLDEERSFEPYNSVDEYAQICVKAQYIVLNEKESN